jgi:uncharacterized protein (TIGR02246 family)
MIRRRLNGLLLLTIAFIAVACAGSEAPSSKAPERNQTSDEEAIRAQIAASETAINKRDFAAIAPMYAPDGDAVIADGPRSSGGNVIRQAIEAAWSTAPKSRQISIAVDGIRFLNADVAIADTTASFSEGEPKQDRGNMDHGPQRWGLARRSVTGSASRTSLARPHRTAQQNAATDERRAAVSSCRGLPSRRSRLSAKAVRHV